MTDTQLANAAAVYFGGRRRAEHLLTCDLCTLTDAGEFRACPALPARREVPWSAGSSTSSSSPT